MIALQALAAAIAAIPGCEGVELSRDTERPARFLFIERWASIEAHAAGAAVVPKATMGAIMGKLAERPAAGWFEPV